MASHSSQNDTLTSQTSDPEHWRPLVILLDHRQRSMMSSAETKGNHGDWGRRVRLFFMG